ncbi:MAG: CopD family protein, partial [Thiobacillus sp.]|nr:CopD family protein [Thiobacillus sp.]
SVALVLLSGLHMLMVFGGMAAPHYAMAMLALGVLMMLIFAQVFFIPYKKLKRAVDEQNWKAGGAALAQIRMLIGINLSLGLLTIAVVFLGRALVP